MFDPFKSLHGVFMAAAFTERVTDGISNRRLDKYYFPLLKVAALLFSTFIQEPVLWGDGVFMSCCVSGEHLDVVGAHGSPAAIWRLSKNWIIVG